MAFKHRLFWFFRFSQRVGLIVALAVLMVPPALAELADPVDRLEMFELDNGLRVLTIEDHSTPVVAFQMWVHAGSKDESFHTGIAHLFEHMMFKGSENIGEEEHARLIGARGGRINAYTSRDVTVYHEDVTSESLPLVIDLEAERVARLDISQENLDDEREVVLEERRLRIDDNPGGLAFEALAALSFQAHPYHWPVIGWRADIEAVTLEACRRFFDTYYSPNNITIVIVGDFDTRQAVEQIEQAFGGLEPAAEIPRNPGQVVPLRGERRSVIHYDVQAPLLYAAWHAPATGHPDADALDVTSQILSAGRSSRLYRALVYDREEALYAQGGYWEMQEAGLFFGVAGVRPGVEIGTVEEGFFQEVERLRTEGVEEAEVAKAKRQLEVSLVNGLSTAHALASRVGRESVLTGRVRPLQERLEAIRAVTAEDVQRVAQTYLDPERRSVVHVVPPVAEAQLESEEQKRGGE
ncbi:MAG: pitrilysin family protein [Myxococcota bacterium]|nr:pitrilysin family protein [Myxococcota bacterium]